MSHPEKTLKITTLTPRTSISQKSISSSATASLAPSMLELSELDPKPEVIETEDTPPSSDKPKTTITRPEDSLSQLQISLERMSESQHKKYEREARLELQSRPNLNNLFGKRAP